MSLAQKVIVSEPGHEPDLEGRPEQGADLYKAILEDTGSLPLCHMLFLPLCHMCPPAF